MAPIMFELHAVIKACQKPAGGLKAIAIIEPTDLAVQPVWYLEPNIPELEFLADKSAYAFLADRFTARLTDKTVTGDRQGDRFEYLLQAFVSGIRPEIELLRAKIRNRRYHVVATYQDDTRRFLPWMRISADGDSGDRSNKNGYSFTGTMRMHRPAPYLDATFTLPIGPSTMVPGTIVHSDTTTSSTWSYEIPADRLLVVVFVFSSSTQEVSLGTTAGGTELGGPAYIPGSQYGLLGSNNLRTTAATTIYLSGLVGSNTIEVWTLVKQ